MPDPTNQLAAIPFGVLIGAPLNAAVEAQAKAAQSTLDFIKAIGFNDDGEVENVTFTFARGDDEISLVVPILTIVPIPFIRIDDMSIDFKAKLSASSETGSETSNTTEAKASVSAKAKYLFVSAKLDASFSSKKDSKATANSKYSVEYTMDIHVHAMQDDVPAGLAEVLKILTENVRIQAPAPQPEPEPTPG
ncbi:MAG: DUF2589 domain-containing protein [Planctomycetota bacterium]